VQHRRRVRLLARREIDPDSPLEWLDTGRSDVLAFRRGDHVCVTVFDGAPYRMDAGWGRVVLASADVTGQELPVGASAWLRR
jgi:alpha-glucosidase